MGNNALSSFGTLLKKGDGGGPEAFTTIAEVQDIEGPELGLDTEESTSHDSAGGWEDFVPTILRSGDVSFEINYNPTHATHNAATGLIADMKNRTKRNFQLVFPNAGSTTWSFAAYVTKFQPKAPTAGKLAASVTMKLTGQPTLA